MSIEVDPRLACDTDATIAQAMELAKIIVRSNVLITAPPAITAVLAAGITGDVTLTFSLDPYE